jgi:hypothetical protein
VASASGTDAGRAPDQFLINAEAVVPGFDGISDFNALHAGKDNHDVQLHAFDGGT